MHNHSPVFHIQTSAVWVCNMFGQKAKKNATAVCLGHIYGHFALTTRGRKDDGRTPNANTPYGHFALTTQGRKGHGRTPRFCFQIDF